jgi:hypothetical protein
LRGQIEVGNWVHLNNPTILKQKASINRPQFAVGVWIWRAVCRDSRG